ncbi:MAG: hypothetical protein U1E27_04655 [Kiritimatiellia bacterium]|nr:hypothetical protein [Kiritimatiellia bacterium]
MATNRYSHIRTGWLWGCAIFVFMTGGLISYSLYLQPLRDETTFRMVSAVTITLTGICVISATAHRWLNR